MAVVEKFKIDRIDDRQIKYVFFVTYLIGAVITLFTHLFDNQIMPMIFLSILMIIYYTIIISIKKKYNLFIRDEQIGDSFYYLGFLYTITALATSLFSLEDGNFDGLLKKFGIAIITTLIGLVGRIILSQFRENLDELEEEAESQISDAVRKLKTQLDMSVDLLRQQSENISKNTDQTLQDSSASLRRFMEENNKILQETTEKSQKVIDEFNRRASEISNKLAEVNIPTDKFKDFEISVNNIVSTLKNLEKGIKDSDAQNELIKTAQSFKSLSASINQQSQLLNNEFKLTKDTLQSLSNNLVGVAKFISENLKKK